MPRGLGFGALTDDENGAGGLTLPPPKKKQVPAPVPKDALATEGAALGFVSREPGKGGLEAPSGEAFPDASHPQHTERPLEGQERGRGAVVAPPLADPGVSPSVRSVVGEGREEGRAKPAAKLKGRRRVAQSKLLIAGRKSVLDEFQQFAWERDLPYWEALAVLLEQNGSAS